jgi:hypothetical protein
MAAIANPWRGRAPVDRCHFLVAMSADTIVSIFVIVLCSHSKSTTKKIFCTPTVSPEKAG